MKIFTAASFALLLSTSVASSCEIQRVTANDGFAYMRAKPNLRAAPLWKLGNDVAVVWCGRSSTDSRGIVWNWVATEWNSEQWPHKGWISNRMIEREVPTITRGDAPAETFEEGGE